MCDAVLATRQILILGLCLLMALAEKQTAAEVGDDAAWMAPLRKEYGWEKSELKNKIQQGDVTTFELGTPNYQILNPEDEPEFITEDQPHYREMLTRLTSANASDTIDLAIPSSSSNASSNSSSSSNASSNSSSSSKATASKWDKLKKRSFEGEPEENESPDEVDAVPLDERSRHPRVHVYAGAKPFQTRIANLS